MTKWTRLQDKIASHRLLTGGLLIFLSCLFLFLFYLMGTDLKVYYNYRTKGIITNFEALQEGGIGSHHMQYVNLTGLLRLDMPIDIVDNSGNWEYRLLIIQDEATKYAILINNHDFTNKSPAEITSVYGYVRKMDDDTYEFSMYEFGDVIEELRAEGWTIDLRYYINDEEKISDSKQMRSIIITFTIILSLMVFLLVLLLVPHPKLPRKPKSSDENDPFGSIVRQLYLF